MGLNLERITIYVPKEFKEFLKTRDVSMSHWVRTWIRSAIHRQRHLNDRYHTDLNFREKRHQQTRDYKRKSRRTQPKNYRV